MKPICLGVLYLLLAAACAADVEEDENAVEAELEDDPELSPIAVFQFDDETHALGTFPMNWYQAELMCAAQGYSLVSINSEEDFAAIRKFVTTTAKGFLSQLKQPVWTSGTNQAYTSIYTWHDTGAFVAYDNFETNPPSSGARCIGVHPLNGVWTTHSCSEQRYFICKKRAC
ncbi:CG8343 [Drosophila busckii]|uniref:CG8343 n=1 Tax=Drosophila busckii TaxID=30019 RepID=A0A0M4EBL3_DROBS|nr:lymphocyte antigen 75 [Drosophila busckii]ALC42671.1 CG8343 [Drosophila busckii]